MPRIEDHIVNCSIFMYKSEAAAKAGEHFGGSGFLVHVPSISGARHVYAVTNKHVLDAGFHVIRLTKKAGGVEPLKTKPDDWFHNPDGNDVAVLSIDLERMFDVWSVSTDLFITHEIISIYNIGIGDDAFLVGRLVHHDGKQRNAPITRFGNVSLMADPKELVECKGRQQEGFLVECRSLSGFSGSPVFVETRQEYEGSASLKVAQHRGGYFIWGKSNPNAPGKIEHMQGGGSGTVWIKGKFGPWLMGIDWGHVPLWSPVYEKASLESNKTGEWTEANTGIACVLPAWHILRTLNQKALVKLRKERDEEIAGEPKIGTGSANDAAGEPSVQTFSIDDSEGTLKR
jgi:hypothetical protein